MNAIAIDRVTFLDNLRKSRLLSQQQFRLVVEKLGHVESVREIAKALATWKLVTKFQAKMLLLGRSDGFFVGPYRILDELGHGGMGRVYQALHEKMGRIVALKILSPQRLDEARAEAMFQREVRAAAQLHHANIVMAFDASEADGRPYLAMEYVDGPNLEQYVQQHGALPIGLACEIIFQAAAGLQHAHEKRIVHRDIKPANLLLQQEFGAKTIQVKILDFGLARFEGHRENAQREEHSVMGTPDFVAPEQAKSLQKADIRSDLYSLGCTLYFLLTGQVPFPGGNIIDKLNRHERDQATPVEILRPEVPSSVANIVWKLMAKNPRARYQTPSELLDALAPHAAPTPMAWPLARPDAALTPEQDDEPTALQVRQVDTEPRAQASTQVNEGSPRERRKTRRAAIAGQLS